MDSPSLTPAPSTDLAPTNTMSDFTGPSTPASLTMMSSTSDVTSKGFWTPTTTGKDHVIERSESVPKLPTPPKSRSFPERVTESTKTILGIETERRLFTDSTDLYPFGMCPQNEYDHPKIVSGLLKKCVGFRIWMRTDDQINEAEGQGCLIKTGKGFVIATVKHNFCKDVNANNQLERFLWTVVAPLSTQSIGMPFFLPRSLGNWDARYLKDTDSGAFRFKSRPDKPNAGWKYGHEVELLPLGERNSELMEAIEQGIISPFQPVSSTFKCKAGMQVGIMAHSCVNLLATSMQESLMSESENYVARAGDTFITVGRLTHVGDGHIEYSVNTVPGYSGAPVFLLAEDQDDDDNHMKLVGIHAGFSDALGTNFGFLVAKQVEELEHGNSLATSTSPSEAVEKLQRDLYELREENDRLWGLVKNNLLDLEQDAAKVLDSCFDMTAPREKDNIDELASKIKRSCSF